MHRCKMYMVLLYKKYFEFQGNNFRKMETFFENNVNPLSVAVLFVIVKINGFTI